MTLWSCLICPAAAAAAQPIPQGVFEDCAGDDGIARCVSRLRTIGAGGFTLVIDYSQFYGSAADQIAYARAAAVAHVRIIWNFSEPAFYDGTDLRRHFPSLARTCACASNAGFIAYAVDLVRELPATWGYFVGDEPPPGRARDVRALSARIHALDPHHPRLLVAVGDPDPAIAERAVAPFAATAEYLAADYYPVGAHEAPSAVRAAAANVAAFARRSRAHWAFVLQAFDWGQYPDQTSVCTPLPQCARFPTSAEMRTMRRAAIDGGRPALLLWYSFFDIMRSNDPRRHWNDLRYAARPL